MNKILIVFIVIFIILILYSFQSCNKNNENFYNLNEAREDAEWDAATRGVAIADEETISGVSVNDERINCMERCKLLE